MGWVLSGMYHHYPRPINSIQTYLISTMKEDEIDLHTILQKFWEVEEVPENKQTRDPDDQCCEDIFAQTHCRLTDGRYMVRLPLKCAPPAMVNEIRQSALGSFRSLQLRLRRNPSLGRTYEQFMQMYESLGHMERVPESDLKNLSVWYLPHHAVVQQTIGEPKIRVVFDGSRRTSHLRSLNDHLLAGPPLQRDLTLILTNWRRYVYAFTADIVKMFRQIWVHPRDRDLQRIWWAPLHQTEPIEYRLTIVTYGTACAPFDAMRTLEQLANDEGNRFLLGARCIKENTYIDNIFAGADDLETAVEIRNELIALMRTAGIDLDKWASN